jgi:hypothetical protein
MSKKLRSAVFSSFFLHMDPDSESGSTQVIESGSNPDPDPQPWSPGNVTASQSFHTGCSKGSITIPLPYINMLSVSYLSDVQRQ